MARPRERGEGREIVREREGRKITRESKRERERDRET